MSDLFRASLKTYRNRRRWSQEHLAFEAEMDHSLVSRLESGQRKPTRDAIAKLVPVLQLTAREATILYLSAGLTPPDLDIGHLMTALIFVTEMTTAEIEAARRLIAVARDAT